MNSEVTLEQLRGLSDKAAPGEWTHSVENHDIGRGMVTRRSVVVGGDGENIIRLGYPSDDCAFIAACVNEIRRQLTTPPASGEVVGVPREADAYLHTVVQDDGEQDFALSFAPDGFPLQGVGGFRSIRCEPLYLSAAPKQAMGWISVEDRLPEQGAGWVLVARNVIGGRRVDSAVYEEPHPGNDRQWLRLRCPESGKPYEFAPCDVTHWRPYDALPSPPEKAGG